MHMDRYFGSCNTPVSGAGQRQTRHRWLMACAAMTAMAWTLPAAAARCYVNGAAGGVNSGTSWADAYTSLQTSLGDANCTEVWVAKGVYKPVVPVNIGAVTVAERSMSFNISPGVAVYGGFAGGEASLSARDPVLNATVLSGDLDNNDDSNNADGNAIAESHTEIAGSNSRHVVVMNGTVAGLPITASTVLDGFTLTGGDNTNASPPTEAGGALWCRGEGASHACSPTLARLMVSGNRAISGGGMGFIGVSSGVSSPTLTHVTFRGNRATGLFGGAMYNYAEASGTSNPTLAYVTFVDNSSATYGGAMVNSAPASGVSSPKLTNVTFIGNLATQQGGAVFNQGGATSNPTFTSVTFTGNSASFGGAMYNVGTGMSVNLNNVILWNNSAPSGPEIFDSGAVSFIFWGIVTGGNCPNSCANLVAGDPLLGSLADNGSFTPTLMPAAGSAAINAVPCHVASATDQRVFARPDPASAGVANPCDVGAVEVGSLDYTFANGFESPSSR